MVPLTLHFPPIRFQCGQFSDSSLGFILLKFEFLLSFFSTLVGRHVPSIRCSEQHEKSLASVTRTLYQSVTQWNKININVFWNSYFNSVEPKLIMIKWHIWQTRPLEAGSRGGEEKRFTGVDGGQIKQLHTRFKERLMSLSRFLHLSLPSLSQLRSVWLTAGPDCIRLNHKLPSHPHICIPPLPISLFPLPSSPHLNLALPLLSYIPFPMYFSCFPTIIPPQLQSLSPHPPHFFCSPCTLLYECLPVKRSTTVGLDSRPCSVMWCLVLLRFWVGVL